MIKSFTLRLAYFLFGLLVIVAKSNAGAGTNVTICGSAYQLSADPLGADETGKWTTISGGGAFSNNTSPISSITGLAQGDNSLRWTVTNTITSSVVGYNVTVRNDRPTTALILSPNTPSRGTCNSTFNSLTGNTNPIIGNGFWSVISGSGSFNNPTNRMTNVTGLGIGSNILTWTISNGQCSSVATVNIFFNKVDAGSNQIICSDTAVLSGTEHNIGATYNWSSANGVIDDVSSLLTTITGLPNGSNSVQLASIIFFPAPSPASICPSFTTILYNEVSVSNAGSNQTLCSNTTTLTGNSPGSNLGSGQWSILTSGTGFSFSNQSFSGTTITNIPEGNSILEWKISKGICESASTVTITNNAPTAASILGTNQIICFDNTTISGNVPTQGTGLWSIVSATGSILTPNLNTTSVTGISLGSTNTYMWSVSFPGCPASTSQITVTRQNPEIAQVQTKYFPVCNTNIVTITALNTTPGIGVWQIVSGSGTIANANSAVTNVTFTGDGRIQLNWIVNISGCTSTFDTLTIDHNSVSSANAGINQTICFDNTILNAATPAKGTGMWIALNTVSGSILSPNLPNATVTGLSPNANVFRWSVTSVFCASMANVTITNNQPSTSVTIADQVLCTNQGFLQANSPQQGIGTWTLKSGSGSIAGINAATTLGANLGLGKNVFNWTINKNGCTSVDSLSLFNNAPTTAQAGASKIVCTDIVNLIANTPAQGNGLWTVVSGTGTLLSSVAANTTVTGLSYSSNVFQWTITTSGCSASTSLVTITNSKVTAPDAGADTCIIASASSLYLHGNTSLNAGEKVLWTTVVSPPVAITFSPASNSQLVTVSGASSGYYQFSYTISDASNNCSATDLMAASINTPASSVTSQCLAMDVGVTSLGANLSGTTPNTSAGEIGRWAVVTNPASTNLILNATTGGVAGLEKGVHVFSYTISNTNYPSCSSSVNAVVAVITKANAGSDVCLGGINSTTLVANPNNPINTAVGGVGTWTGSNIVTTGAVSSILGTVSNLQNGVNAFSFIVYNSNYPSCQSVSSVQVTRMTVPNVGVDTFLIASPITNQAGLQLYANTVNSGVGETGLWSFANSISSSAAFSAATLPNSSVTGLSPGANALRWTISNQPSNANCSLNGILNVYVQSKANSGASKKIVILNATPSVPKTATLTGINITASASTNGEYGQWSLVSTNAPQTPTSVSGPGLSTVSLDNLRRGVSVFRWTIYNSNFPINPKYTNHDSVQITVMTKAKAGRDTCLKNVTNFNLGNSPTVPIRPASNERFGWTCSNPAVTLNPTISDAVNSVPGLQITNLPIGRTRFYLSITNTGSGAVDTDSVLLTNITNPSLGVDPQIYTNTFQITPPTPYTVSGETFTWAKVSGNSVFSTSGFTLNVLLNDFNNNVYSYKLYNPISIAAMSNCFFSDSINIRNGAPSTANARNDTTICNNFVKLYADVPLQGNGFWSVSSGTGIIQNANAVITTVTGLSQGINVFLWTITTSGGSSADLVTITNNSVTTPNAGIDICTTVVGNGTTAIYLDGNAPNTSIGEAGLWTTVSGTGIKPVLPLGNPINVSVAGLASGFFRYNYTISDVTNQCKLHDTVAVTIVPLASVNGINQCLPIGAGLNTLSTALTSPNTFKSGEIGRWSIVSSADFPLPVLNSVTGTVTGLRKGISEFSFTVSNTNASSCVNSNAANIKISVITKANAGVDTCMPGLNAITLIANKTNLINSTVGGVGTWLGSNIATTVQTTGALASPSAVITNLQFGINTFYFNVFNSNVPGCISRDTVVVTQMTKSSAGKDTFLLGSPASLALYANNPSAINESGQWTFIPSPFASFPPGGAFIPNSTVSGLGFGINKLKWTLFNTANSAKTCASLDTIDIYVQSKANAGIIKKSVFKNANPSIALSTVLSPVGNLSTSNGEYGVWTLVSTNAPQLPILSAIGTNLQLSNLRRGAFIFKWTVYNSNFPLAKNYFNSDNDTLTVMTKAIAGNDLCLSDTVNLTLGNRQTVPIRPSANERFSWTSSDPLVGLSYNSSDSIPILNVSLPLGVTTFYFTITNTGTMAIDTSSMTVRKLTNPKLSGVYTNPICDTTYQLNVAPTPNSTLGENFTWTKVNGSSKFSDLSLNPIVSPLDTGNNKFRFSIYNQLSKDRQTGKYCTLSDSIIVRNNQPYFATISGIAESCYTSNTLQGNNPKLQFPTATAKWLLVSQPAGNPNLTFDDDTKPNVNIFNMVLAGNYEFTYFIKNLGCTYTVPSTFTIVRNNTLETSAGPDATICGTTYIMNADTLKSGETGQWITGTSGFIPTDQEGNPKATVTGISQTQFGDPFNFQWRISKGECKSLFKTITIYSFLNPSIADIGTKEIQLCELTTLTINTLNTGIIGNPSWYAQVAGNASFGNVNTTTGSVFVQNIAYGSNPLIYQISNGNCVPSRDTVNVVNFHKPMQVNANSVLPDSICGDTIELMAPIVDVGIGRWTELLTTITSQILNADSAKTLVTNVNPGLHIFAWKVTNGTCISSFPFSYPVIQKPTKAKIFANDSTLCANTNLVLNGSIPIAGAPSWKSLAGNALFTTTTLNSVNLQINDLNIYKIEYRIATQYTFSSGKKYCYSFDTIQYARVNPPSQAIATPDTSICYDNVILKGNKPLITETSFWTSANNLPFTTVDESIIRAKSLPAGQSIFVYNISVPGCMPSQATVNVTSKGYPLANAGNDTLLCTNSYQLRASQPLFSAGGSGKWTKLNGTSGFSNDTINTALVNGLANGNNVFVWTNYYDNCPNTDDTLIVTNNRVVPLPQFPEETVYTSSVILNAVTPQNAIGKWWVLKGTSVLSDPENPNATLSNMSKGENILRWTLKSPGCDTGYADKKIIFNNLKIPVGFSPNKDDANQAFEILGLSEYPNLRLEVLNRWGKLVYKSDNYKNNWEGTNLDNEPLADDSYFYIIKVSAEEKPITGFVQIKR